MTEPTLFSGARDDVPKSGLTGKRLAILVVLLAALGVGVYYGQRYLTKPWTPLDTPLGQALGRSLPSYLIDVQNDLKQGARSATLEDRAAAVLDPKSRKELGDAGAQHFEAMLKAEIKLETFKSAPADLKDIFLRESIAFNDEAAARGLPYFLDATLIHSPKSGATSPMVYAYYIEDESSLRGAGRTVRAIHVRRLDNLNIAQAAMGYTKPSSTAALVLLDQLESHLLQYVLPALPKEGDTVLVDLESLDPESPWQIELRDRSSAVVKDAYASVPGMKEESVAELGKLLHRRRELVRSWMKALDKQNIRLHMPSRLVPEADYAMGLYGHIPATELSEWNALHDRLLEPEVLRAFEAIRDQYARSIEQHEAQHQLDYARTSKKMPPKVAAVMGMDPAEELAEGSFNAYVVGEVSAYLAEIARGPDSPGLLLMVLLQSAFDAESWGGAYCYAALAVLDALGRELGLPDEKFTGRGQVLRDKVTLHFIAIANKPWAEVRDAARKAWEATFEAKLPDVVLEKTVQNKPWIH